MDRKRYTVSISVEVFDPEYLRSAALIRAKEQGIEVSDWNASRLDGEPVANDLRMLLDPGESPPGTSILDSFAEEE